MVFTYNNYWNYLPIFRNIKHIIIFPFTYAINSFLMVIIFKNTFSILPPFLWIPWLSHIYFFNITLPHDRRICMYVTILCILLEASDTQTMYTKILRLYSTNKFCNNYSKRVASARSGFWNANALNFWC